MSATGRCPPRPGSDTLVPVTSAPCIFCDLLSGAGRAEWLVRGAHAAALLPLRNGWLAPGHTLVISDEHAVGVQDVSPTALQAVILLVQRISHMLHRSRQASGVNVLNASGAGSDQSVAHLHFHVVPRWPDDGLDTCPSGRSSRPVPDDLAGLLRDGLD